MPTLKRPATKKPAAALPKKRPAARTDCARAGPRRAKGFDKFQDFEHNMGHDSFISQATAACDNLE
jgi:hypothetical protein